MRPRRTLIVGTDDEARLVHRKIASHPEYGLNVIGFLEGQGDTDGLPAPVVGSQEDIAAVVDEFEVDRVLLASSIGSHEEMLDLLRTVRRPDVQVSIVPRYFEIFNSHATLDDVEGMPVVTLPPMRLGSSARLLKRSFDVAVSTILLALLAPVLLIIGAAIRLDSNGPALYWQPRRGRLGSTFHIVKFRTMSVGSEQRRRDVLHLNEVDGPLFKIKGIDPRVTRVGRFLRRTSLDELPQLWNVLCGEMSLVGPRPFVVYEADQITGWATRRLDMTPGITGIWQVLGRNDMPFAEMVKLDYLYVTNWSLWWDLKILCQTIPVVVGRRGAY
jgi:exopolysaccharide biosynthesis polyprenyl glycosylphosphotransferase